MLSMRLRWQDVASRYADLVPASLAPKDASIGRWHTGLMKLVELCYVLLHKDRAVFVRGHSLPLMLPYAARAESNFL